MKIILISTLSIFSLTAHAFNGNELHNGLTSSNKYEVELAKQFATGVIAAMGYGKEMEWQAAKLEGRTPTRFLYACFPKDAILEQPLDLIADYLKEHPESRQESAVVLINRALLETWGCKSTD